MAKTHGFLFSSLKDCFVFFSWLHEGDGKVYLEPVISYLHQRVSKYYNWIDSISIKVELSNFLGHVTRFYGKLVFTVTKDAASIPGDKKMKSAEHIVNALLECLPKFLAAMYYLWYNVDVTFRGVGGGGWAENWLGYGGGLDTYLTKPYRSASGGIIPGGFELRELRYGWVYANYTQGKKMTTDLRWILDKKVEQNYFRDVLALSTIIDSGTESVNTANALAVVNLFCEIVAEEAKKKESGNLRKKLDEMVKPKCLNWTELQLVCSAIKTSYANMFTHGPFDITGEATKASYLKSEDFAVHFARWYKEKFERILQHVGKMHSFVTESASFNNRSLVTTVFYPNGIVYKGNNVVQANGFLEHWEWTNALESFVDDNRGLRKLKELLDGTDQGICSPPAPTPELRPTPALAPRLARPAPPPKPTNTSTVNSSGAQGSRGVVANSHTTHGSRPASGVGGGRGGRGGTSHSRSGAQRRGTEPQPVAQKRADSPPRVQASPAQRTTQSQPKSAPQNAANSDSQRVADIQYTGGVKGLPAPSVSVPQNHATSSTITVQKPDIPSLSAQAKADHSSSAIAATTPRPSGSNSDSGNHVSVDQMRGLQPHGQPESVSSVLNPQNGQPLQPDKDAADTHHATDRAASDGSNGIGVNVQAGEIGSPGGSDSTGSSTSPLHPPPPAQPQPLPASHDVTAVPEAPKEVVPETKVPVMPPKKPEVPPNTAPIMSESPMAVATKTEATKTEASKPVVAKAEYDESVNKTNDQNRDTFIGPAVAKDVAPSPRSDSAEAGPTGSPVVHSTPSPTLTDSTVSCISSEPNTVQNHTLIPSTADTSHSRPTTPTGDAVAPGSPSRSIRQGVGLNDDAHSGKQLVSSPRSEPSQSSNGQAQLQGHTEPSTSIPAPVPPSTSGDADQSSQGGASSSQQLAVSQPSAQPHLTAQSAGPEPSAASSPGNDQGDLRQSQQSGISNALESDTVTTITSPDRSSVDGDGGASGSGGNARGGADGGSQFGFNSTQPHAQLPNPSDANPAATTSVGSGPPVSPDLTPISSPQENSHDQGAYESAKSTATVSQNDASDIAGRAGAAGTPVQQTVDNEGNGSQGQPSVAVPDPPAAHSSPIGPTDTDGTPGDGIAGSPGSASPGLQPVASQASAQHPSVQSPDSGSSGSRASSSGNGQHGRAASPNPHQTEDQEPQAGRDNVSTLISTDTPSGNITIRDNLGVVESAEMGKLWAYNWDYRADMKQKWKQFKEENKWIRNQEKAHRIQREGLQNYYSHLQPHMSHYEPVIGIPVPDWRDFDVDGEVVKNDNDPELQKKNFMEASHERLSIARHANAQRDRENLRQAMTKSAQLGKAAQKWQRDHQMLSTLLTGKATPNAKGLSGNTSPTEFPHIGVAVGYPIKPPKLPKRISKFIAPKNPNKTGTLTQKRTESLIHNQKLKIPWVPPPPMKSPSAPPPQPIIDFDVEQVYKSKNVFKSDTLKTTYIPVELIDPALPLDYYPGPPQHVQLPQDSNPDVDKMPALDFCVPLWTSQTPNDDFDDIPEIELFPAEAPRTIRDMLRWIVGIRRPKHLEVLEKCINDALGKVPDGVPGNPTLCVSNTKLKSEDVIKALKLASIFSSSVLSAIEPDWKQKSSRSGTVKRKDTDHDQDPDGCALLCCLQDYVYACYHQLAFLRSQCAGDKFRGGWMGCQFGRDVTADSPLQAFLTDAYYSRFKTHLFDPCDVCLKSRIRMGFRKGDFSKSAKDGSYIYYLLSPSCSGDDDPLMTLSSYLNCLTRRTPRTTGELVSFFQHFGSEMRKDVIGILSDMGKALSTPHPNCPEWDHLRRHDLDAVRGIRVSESPVSKHDNDHAGTLSTLVGCDMTNVQCTKLLSPITHRAYAMYSPCFVHTYLSWAVYLADTLRESLDRLRYDFTRHNVSKCGSIHHCHDALPYLYFHGFTPPEGTPSSSLTCSQVITKLKEVVNGGPIAKLINCMDDFLYRVRWPFIYTVITLWSTAFLLFAHTALYRLDVLRIQSHFMRSRGSHVIDVKALLTEGTKMPSLYDIDYFDDEALAHAWNRIY
ncbi:hypothetical protein BBBOND_0400080 [Babesia bigemina]|uniref:Ribosome-binding protein 1 n=1 Tax=Babesia bigemina TaxID=5866 RepID=A0A061DBZ6_BABBI|nr:hypothetical protein BBBOND_0400080 [Babesia bigemina]CDR97512.1 hypothetical protein BBBOND_0400080 [Babesia bigemina]|eukprot:XP_012769698.1 hypothetical protein BBBOND_0400080 [Babesia bigemina]